MTASTEIITGSPWKGKHFVSSMNDRGVAASVAEMLVYADEPDHSCPWKLSGKLTKYLDHPVVRDRYSNRDEPTVVTAIDINGLLMRNRIDRKPKQITTSRGKISGVEKVLHSAHDLSQNLRGRGSARSAAIVFQNVVARGRVYRDEVENRMPFIDTGLISLSAPLIRALSSRSFIREVIEWGDTAGVAPLVNERSSAGLDFTVIPMYILGLVGSGMEDPGFWMSLMLPNGERYVADGTGYSIKMVHKLNPLLRGITDRNADQLAEYARKC